MSPTDENQLIPRTGKSKDSPGTDNHGLLVMQSGVPAHLLCTHSTSIAPTQHIYCRHSTSMAPTRHIYSVHTAHLLCPQTQKSIMLGTNGAAVDNHGFILSQNGATRLGKLFKYPPGLRDVTFISKGIAKVNKTKNHKLR